MVGHSIACDLKILSRLGVDVYDIAPVVGIFDTHRMARKVFGESSGTTLKSSSLGDVLEELGCPVQRQELHVAGNDATFTLWAMLWLVMGSCERYGVKSERLEGLRGVAWREMGGERWRPMRRALGFYAPADPAEEI